MYGFLVKNLVPVTLGNIVGGGFFVATLYWFAYVRKSKQAA
jgi:formate/nitrite transporter FocA (FNT family)